MKKLSFKHNNVEFLNPFLLASSPLTRNAEMIMRGFKAGWGGAVLKTLNLCPETMNNVSQRMYGHKIKSSVFGLKNIEMISDRPIEDWICDIKLMKDKYPNRVIVASIMAEGINADEWQKLTEITQEAGSDIIELNLSCPNGVPERGMGSYCSEIPQLCGDIVKAVKQVSKIPVWAKLSPNVTSISYLAECCLAEKADGIVAINTVKGFAGIDIETLQPKLSINGLSTYGGFSGQIIKPMALKAVSEIAKDHNCYVSATGGITTWQDAIEFMLLGASSLQLCTEVMYKGYDIINPLLEGVESYLSKYNYDSLESIVGLALDKVTNYGSLDNKVRYSAEICQETCRNCGRCLIACRDGGYQAIIKNNNSSYQVEKENCVGCGFCQSVCSVGSISMNVIKQDTPALV